MVNCFVPNCNHYSETKICKFFRFPVNKLLKLKWTKNIRCPSVNSRVCSWHFIDGLKENNPTIFSWNKEKRFLCVSPEKRNKRIPKPISKTLVANEEELPDELEENHSEVASQSDIEIESQMNLYESTKHNEENSVLHLNVKSVGSIIDEPENALLKIEIERLNSTINSLKKQPFSFAFIEDNDEAITYYTGMPNKTVIHVLFDIF
ncbi:uncharacterized protein LOC112595730 [Melanaphis sacchari]|uniref:uncharacterized protein LOC112595730 n=1 Tax=Melanaphis sacchari TaxID=742174 RepID=UPI000DC15AA5|nr:uncharacterized protein LOC112595730 [Melanaphis sacchari]